MIQRSLVTCVFAAFALVGVAAVPAAAQSPRTWVSASGYDGNPCTPAQPCRTFAAAYDQTIAGGEIDALDAGDFGIVTITKAITIDGGAAVAGVTTNSSAFVIQAGANDVVTLRNLSIHGTSGAIFGMWIKGGRNVFIDHCSISGFSDGIAFVPLGGMTLTVTNTTLSNNWARGIFVSGTLGAFFARFTATNVRLVNNGVGMKVEDNVLALVKDSSASDNTNDGFEVVSGFGGAAQLSLEDTSSSNNGNAGIVSQYGGAVVRISNSTIDHNGGAGVVPLSGGQTLSYGNNRVAANAAGNGTMTGPAGVM